MVVHVHDERSPRPSRTPGRSPYVSHFWSLAVEEHFYLVWPICVFYLPLDTLAVVAASCAGGALALRITLAGLGVGSIPILVLTPCRLDALAIGALLAIGQHAFGLHRLARSAARVIGPLALTVGGLSAWNAARASHAVLVLPLRGFALALLFAALVGVAAGATPGGAIARLFTLPALRALGKYSYGLYVFHGIVAYAMFAGHLDRGIAEYLGSHWLGMLAFSVLGAASSLLLSGCQLRALEAPFLRLKDRLAPARGRHEEARASSDLMRLVHD